MLHADFTVMHHDGIGVYHASQSCAIPRLTFWRQSRVPLYFGLCRSSTCNLLLTTSSGNLPHCTSDLSQPVLQHASARPQREGCSSFSSIQAHFTCETSHTQLSSSNSPASVPMLPVALHEQACSPSSLSRGGLTQEPSRPCQPNLRRLSAPRGRADHCSPTPALQTVVPSVWWEDIVQQAPANGTFHSCTADLLMLAQDTYSMPLCWHQR